MSHITKSELLEQNRQMMNVLAEIHRLTAPFVGMMANRQDEPNQPTETPKNAKSGSKMKVATSSARKNRSKPNSPMPEQTANGNGIKRRSLRSDGTENADRDAEFLGYLKLRKVPKSADDQRRSSRKAAPSVSGVQHIMKTPRVILNRLTPAQIMNARQLQSVRKVLEPHGVAEDRRQTPHRKAAPTNLKEPQA